VRTPPLDGFSHAWDAPAEKVSDTFFDPECAMPTEKGGLSGFSRAGTRRRPEKVSDTFSREGRERG
jgi:hypothetical protein